MIALDTNVVATLLKGTPLPQLEDETLYIPLAVLAELKSGTLSGNNPSKYLPILEAFISDQHVQLSTGHTPEMVNVYAELYVRLKTKGTPISPNDLWIATECLYHDLTLATFDKDFEHVPDLRLFDQ